MYTGMSWGDMSKVEVSICMVTLNACTYLRESLISLMNSSSDLNLEVILVDNASTDGTAELVQHDFPQVKFIQNDENEGFARPMNKAMLQAVGRYLLLLNPDTILQEESISNLVVYMEAHPEIGICGPKVLNQDGTLQKSCRRGIAKPWNTFTYFSGLADLFPHSKCFGGYQLNYLDEDLIHEVDGVSGSCMMIRREVIDQIGYLDERFFAYQEDADYCFQAQNAGWKIYYIPTAKIYHYGGKGGSHVQPYRSLFEWHRSYFMYYRKNLAKDYFFLFNGFYYLAMGLKLLVSLLVNIGRADKFPESRRR
jgi:GT2 family glycosyltransferase